MTTPPHGSRPFQEYPKMVYHLTYRLDGSHKSVQNSDEQRGLGPEWFEHPDKASAAFDLLTPAEQLEVLSRSENSAVAIDRFYKEEFELAPGREKLQIVRGYLDQHPHLAVNSEWAKPYLAHLPGSPPRVVVLPPGSQYDAYKQLSHMLESANSSIAIVDNYVDRTVLDMLQACKENVPARVLTRPVKPDFELALKKFKAQFKRTIEVRVSREVHDRYVVVDDEDFYWVGASLKDAGDKLSLLVKLEEPSAIATLRNKIEEIWNRASPL